MKAKITPEIAFKRVFVYSAAMWHIVGEKPISRELSSLARSAAIQFPTIESIRASAVQSGLLTPDFKLTQTGEMIMHDKLTLTGLPADSAVIKSLSLNVKFNFTKANRDSFDILNLGADCFNSPNPVQIQVPDVAATPIAKPETPDPPASEHKSIPTPEPVFTGRQIQPIEPTIKEEDEEEGEEDVEDVSVETAKRVDWDAMGKAMRKCNHVIAEGRKHDKDISALKAQCAGQKPTVKKHIDIARKFVLDFTKSWVSANPDKAEAYGLKDWSLKANKAAWNTFTSGGCLQDGYIRISTALNSIAHDQAKFKGLVDFCQSKGK